jgi:phi13 family phage major tail protein
MNVRIGAENLTFAKLLTDPAGGTTTYDVPFAISKKLIKVGLKNASSIEPQYADDQAGDVLTDDGDITIDINVTDLTEDEKAIIFGQTMAAGIRTPGPNDVRPFFSVSWKSKKRSGTYKYYKLLKVIFKEPDEDFETKKEKVTAQTDTISGLGVQRLSDGFRKRVADADAATYVAATGTGWFTTGDISPDTTPPTVTVLPLDAATGVAVGANFVWTFSEAIQPALVTDGNFFVSKADGTLVAGALTIGTNDTVVTFNPTENLSAATAHIAVCTVNVKDKSGNALAANSVTNFTTA